MMQRSTLRSGSSCASWTASSSTQLLYVAAKLGVAEALADGPKTGAELADAVGADPAALTRVLRGLALEDVLREDGRALRADAAR